MKLHILRTVPLSTIRSFSLYTQQWYMSYRFADSRIRMFHPDPAVSKPVWHIPLLCVQRKTPDGGQRNCPKHVEFHSKNKYEKLLHLVGFIVRKDTFYSLKHLHHVFSLGIKYTLRAFTMWCDTGRTDWLLCFASRLLHLNVQIMY